MSDRLMSGHRHGLNDENLRGRAVAAARGDEPFDILISGGTLVDVVTGELRPADIGLVGPLIASVHPARSREDAQQVLDASGGYVTPGLIDTHMHIESSMITPASYARAVLARGVTTIVWDPHEFANVHGMHGMLWASHAIRDLPLRTILLAPSCVPSAPGLERAGADFDAKALAEILSWQEVGGIAEVMNMRGVIERDPRMSAILQEGLYADKLICGHARGLGGADLNAFMAAGITSDHELTSADDLMAKLRAGLTIELRGSHDHLLPEFVSALNAMGHLPPTLTLCTDDIFPDDLLENGGLDDVVRRLVQYGLRPQWALQAATLNAASRLQRYDLGLIAAGRQADIVVFNDLSQFAARHVLARGVPVAEQGRMIAEVPEIDVAPLENSMKLPARSSDDFRVKSKGRRVRLATIDRPRFTQWAETEADVIDGFIVPPSGTTMISVTHRHGKASPVTRTGFLTGWGQWNGAFATTVSHDSHNLTVFGGNAEDMAAAANAVIEAGGGMAAASGGKVTAVLPLPLSGLVSAVPLLEIADGFKEVREAVGRIVAWQPPYLVFKACFGATLACNIGPHQTDMGIADVLQANVLETPVIDILE
ncbi:adenine deaminase [Oryzifoliimicrobium ureilyticus]|uniref:adenine deaminase n=1 Tax=Oryzifoliimicrobium ureilyticus TaxID=3113724 RepID=UPI003075FD2C